MGNSAHNTNMTSREAALARRRAMSTTGKAAIKGGSAAPARVSAPARSSAAAPSPSLPVSTYAGKSSEGSSRSASRARRQAMSTSGKAGLQVKDRTRGADAVPSAAKQAVTANAGQEAKSGCGCGCGGKNKPAPSTTATPDMSLTPSVAAQFSPNLRKVGINPTRAATLARRRAMSTKGKSALAGGAISEASAARAANPNISSRELAQTLRTQRSQKGKTSKKQGGAVATGPGRHRKAQEASEDQPWKVGVTETASGQAVTGTMVDRTPEVTGNESSTCRAVTGTEYMGADVFKDFCSADAAPSFNRVSVTTTGTGNSISGINVSRAAKVTGNEPGTCKSVTGTEYVSTEQAQAFCATKGPTKPAKFTMAETAKGKSVSGSNVGRSDKVTGDETGASRSLTGTQYMQEGNGSAPAKVGVSETLRGGTVSGTTVGRSEKVTGDEPGSCRIVTGDDYVGTEQYSEFCQSAPAPTDRKVGASSTLMGKSVTGTMTDRGSNVTGNEAGTCKALTGTPYAGAEQTEAFCSSPEKSMAMARARKGTDNVGANMTGIQPGVGGAMTGGSKGACEPLTGTPYVGADQVAKACPSAPAEPNSPDFPQPMGDAPWGEFSVSAPSHAAQDMTQGNVTGSHYEQGQITGPFGMATGKVTGTEESRFGRSNDVSAVQEAVVPETVQEVGGRVKSRITGEGMSAGGKITGDDWDRGDHVTGTEGNSAIQRNPTRRGGPMSAMSPREEEPKRNVELPLPVSKVTGGSGNTEKGSLITYSGGARG